MNTHLRPIVRASSAAEAETLLRRNHLGRIAFARDERIDVEPVHYVYDPPWIFGRLSADATLLTLAEGSWCALETDLVEGPFDWESVVVKGRLSTQRTAARKWDDEQALAALRQLTGGAFPDDEPAAGSDIVFGLYASDVFGRRSTSRGRDGGVWHASTPVDPRPAFTTSTR